MTVVVRRKASPEEFINKRIGYICVGVDENTEEYGVPYGSRTRVAAVRDGQRLRDPCRIHEEVIEAALAGEFRYLDEQVFSERAAGNDCDCRLATPDRSMLNIESKFADISDEL